MRSMTKAPANMSPLFDIRATADLRGGVIFLDEFSRGIPAPELTQVKELAGKGAATQDRMTSYVTKEGETVFLDLC